MRSQRLGSRLGRLRSSHSYRAVVLATVALLVFTVAAPDAAWARATLVLLETVTLALATWTSGLVVRAHLLGAALLLVCVPLAVVEIAHGGTGLAGSGWLVGSAMLVATVGVIGLGVVDQGVVNEQSVMGAISIYLLLGLIFAQAYGAVAALGSAPFFAQGTDGTTSIRAYFSYVTLATLGYGDYTPRGQVARAVVIVEMLLGQLYLVTVVAVLVSRFGRARLGGERD